MTGLITRKVDGRCTACRCVSVCTVTGKEQVLEEDVDGFGSGSLFVDDCRHCGPEQAHEVVAFLTGLEALQEAAE